MIKKINISNFKSIKELEIFCNNNFNVIIGENNIGKTTIFDAIHLWKICYDSNIQKSNKNLFYSSSKNINFIDMEYLRVFQDEDLVNKDMYKTNKDIQIILSVEFNNREFQLGFQITKVSSIDNAYLQVSYVDKDEFLRFASEVTAASYNLTNVIVICESRPVANIIAKEPYMYKNQVLDKISKGKGFEVLRNKVTKSQLHKEKIEEHIKNVMEKEYIFTEVDKDNKTYIRLLVNGTNILSQGSGFLQVTEIFSSLEYTESGMYILLIDEPDSHLHMRLQKNLIKEFRNIPDSQLFIISHNDKFLNEISDEEILFLDEKIKELAKLKHLERGYKNLIIKGLDGSIERIDELRNAKKIILCEGESDKQFLEKMMARYLEFTGKDSPDIYIEKIFGIDTLNDKLLSYSRAYYDIVSPSAKWIVIRDSDCLPISKQNKIKRKSLTYITAADKQMIYQKGYGIESTFVAEIDKFSNLLVKYYELESTEKQIIIDVIKETNQIFAQRVVSVVDDLHKELEKHFLRQKDNRKENIYDELTLRDMIIEINENNIQYIMTKPILNMYLNKIHEEINNRYTILNEPLNNHSIIDFYFNTINRIEDFYEFHQELLNAII